MRNLGTNVTSVMEEQMQVQLPVGDIHLNRFDSAVEPLLAVADDGGLSATTDCSPRLYRELVMGRYPRHDTAVVFGPSGP